VLSAVSNQAQAAAGANQVAMVLSALLGGLLSLSRFSWRGVVAAFVWVFVVSPLLLIPTLTLEQDWDGVPDATLLQRHLLIACVGLAPLLAFWAWRRWRNGTPLSQENWRKGARQSTTRCPTSVKAPELRQAP
jgi:MFS family permease